MMAVTQLALLFLCMLVSGDAQGIPNIDNSTLYAEAYGEYNFYYPRDIPKTQYRFCTYNRNNCQAASYRNYCTSYEATCPKVTSFEGYYGYLASIYCNAWCSKCSDSYNAFCDNTKSPPTTVPPNGITKCNYTNFINKFPRLGGGQPAFQCENPWTVGLRPHGFVNKRLLTAPICQGVLIDQSTVLTVTECTDRLDLFGNGTNGNYTATVGEYIWSVEEPWRRKIVAIKESSFQPGSGIEKMVLQTPITDYNRCAAPACLSEGNRRVNRTNCKMTGWGINPDTFSEPNALRTGEVILGDQTACQTLYSFMKRKNINLTGNIALDYHGNLDVVGCTSGTQSKATACQLDEGGAVTCAEETTGDQILVGLIKAGGCRDYNGTFYVDIADVL